MTQVVTLGFDPGRVHALGRRTSEAIRALDAIRSADPAASHAMRVLRLTRRNLADHWMPLIREIEAGAVMTRWTSHAPASSGPVGVRAAGRSGHHGTPLTATLVDPAFRALLDDLDDGELFDRLEELCEGYVRVGTMIDPTDDRWRAKLGALAAELDERLAVDVDGRFRRMLVEAAPRAPLIAYAAPFAPLLSSLTVDLAARMLTAPRWSAELHPGTYDGGLSELLAVVAETPEVCLDLLLDPLALRHLAEWESLDAGAVRAVVTSGLHTAVAADPQRITDGYAVLRALVDLANGPLEGGFSPGMARGVADAMVGYVDTLAPSLRQEGDWPVTVHSFEAGREFEIPLGTYDDIVDLVGAVIRDRDAQASLGVAVGAYADRVITTLADDVDEHVGVEHVARLADLVRDATDNEDAEIVLAAAAEAARRERIGSHVGFATAMALGPALSVSGHVVRASAQLALELADDARLGDEERLPRLDIASSIAEHITFSVVSGVVRDPSLRTGPHLRRVTDAQWRDVAEHLDDIDTAGDDRGERTARIDRMVHYIERTITPLAAYVRAVQSAPNYEELTEDRARFDRDR